MREGLDAKQWQLLLILRPPSRYMRHLLHPLLCVVASRRPGLVTLHFQLCHRRPRRLLMAAHVFEKTSSPPLVERLPEVEDEESNPASVTEIPSAQLLAECGRLLQYTSPPRAPSFDATTAASRSTYPQFSAPHRGHRHKKRGLDGCRKCRQGYATQAGPPTPMLCK